MQQIQRPVAIGDHHIVAPLLVDPAAVIAKLTTQLDRLGLRRCSPVERPRSLDVLDQLRLRVVEIVASPRPVQRDDGDRLRSRRPGPLARPLPQRELLARHRAALRRADGEASEVVDEQPVALRLALERDVDAHAGDRCVELFESACSDPLHTTHQHQYGQLAVLAGCERVQHRFVVALPADRLDPCDCGPERQLMLRRHDLDVGHGVGGQDGLVHLLGGRCLALRQHVQVRDQVALGQHDQRRVIRAGIDLPQRGGHAPLEAVLEVSVYAAPDHPAIVDLVLRVRTASELVGELVQLACVQQLDPRERFANRSLDRRVLDGRIAGDDMQDDVVDPMAARQMCVQTVGASCELELGTDKLDRHAPPERLGAHHLEHVHGCVEARIRIAIAHQHDGDVELLMTQADLNVVDDRGQLAADEGRPTVAARDPQASPETFVDAGDDPPARPGLEHVQLRPRCLRARHFVGVAGRDRARASDHRATEQAGRGERSQPPHGRGVPRHSKVQIPRRLPSPSGPP